jgi:hypothetical protein
MSLNVCSYDSLLQWKLVPGVRKKVLGSGFEPPVVLTQGWTNTRPLISSGVLSSDIVVLVYALCVSCTKLLGRHPNTRSSSCDARTTRPPHTQKHKPSSRFKSDCSHQLSQTLRRPVPLSFLTGFDEIANVEILCLCRFY